MSVSFLSIPAQLRTPGSYIEFDSSRAVSGLPPAPNKYLLIGQRLAAGTVAALTPTRIVSADQAVQAFGRGSMLAAMARVLKLADPRTECWAVALDDDAGGTAATHTITVTGPATAAGSIALMVAGRQVKIGVLPGDAAATIATAIAAAINADPDMPATAAAAAAVVTLTARHKGTAGSDIDVRHSFYQGEALPAGVALAVAAGVAGAGNPALAGAIAAIGDEQYQTIVLGFADAATLTAIEAELLSRWGPLRQIEGLAFAGARGAHGALLDLGEARNSQLVSIIGAKASPTPPWEWAASYAGVVGFNGAIDPARPFQTLTLPGVIPPAQKDRFTRIERDLLLADGISTFTVDAGGAAMIERAITTYQVNAQGLEDIAFLDVTTPLTLAYIRLAVRSMIGLKYPRHKLADDDTNFRPGQAIVTPRILHAELIALMRQLEEAGLVENIEQFKADLIVERDKTDPGRINALLPPNIVNQFRVFAARIEFRL
ncbi:phage tail protein [Sphingomonas gilva]|uniref:Phage tail protein n=1 Tax=Sphingomonas gilva TaxID=2305907 RepID=A0A396RSA9_9SPHN|nr:phage tail sheath subtilisin-like domain-containing protein [Sphingomonas gilva]RHW17203.1 phage tail protein [Sphingomonas gilva]